MQHWTLGTLNTIDIAILGLVLLSTIIGIVRGFAKESVSLVTWIAATTVSMLYFQKFGDTYLSGIQMVMLRYLLSALILSLGTLILGGIINYMISALIQKTGFSMPDRIIGMIFGSARGLLLVVIGVVITLSFPKLQTPLWRSAALVPFFVPSALWVRAHIHIPENLKAVLETVPPDLNGLKKGIEAPKDAPKEAAKKDEAPPTQTDQSAHDELVELDKSLKAAS